MTIKELIFNLSRMPPEAKVFHIWDGEPRTEIQLVWLSKRGDVMTSDYDQVVYSNEARPIKIKNNKKNKYWQTVSKTYSEGETN